MLLPIADRQPIPELMDAPDLDAAAHRRALAGLRRINRASGAARRMAGPIIELARSEHLDRLSLLDIACGGADVPVRIALLARGAGIQIDLTLMDKSPTALAAAQERAARAGVPARCVAAEIPGGDVAAIGRLAPFDVVTNSLFLHHLRGRAVVDTLAQMKAWARRMVVVSDLRRSRMGLAIAWAGCRVLSRSRIVHHDGPASVQSAWTLGELAALATEAGMSAARIEPSWPWRMMLRWEADP
jgi:2-polyprenyl-3-methyl-5-hydroxy-6-metoxy-1,4-benzoquinol methylase